MTIESQGEPRNQRAATAVTESEKAALRMVSAFDEVSESELLRDWTITQVVNRAGELRQAIRPLKKAEAA